MQRWLPCGPESQAHTCKRLTLVNDSPDNAGTANKLSLMSRGISLLLSSHCNALGACCTSFFLVESAPKNLTLAYTMSSTPKLFIRCDAKMSKRECHFSLRSIHEANGCNSQACEDVKIPLPEALAGVPHGNSNKSRASVQDCRN